MRAKYFRPPPPGRNPVSAPVENPHMSVHSPRQDHVLDVVYGILVNNNASLIVIIFSIMCVVVCMGSIKNNL